jgi:hypothetical protein
VIALACSAPPKGRQRWTLLERAERQESDVLSVSLETLRCMLKKFSSSERRGKVNFVAFIKELLTGAHAKAGRIHLVLDNLNTHFRKCFDDVLGSHAAAKLLRRVKFHDTPKHASWLNMAAIVIGSRSLQCLDQRIANREFLASEVAAWQKARNKERRTIE